MTISVIIPTYNEESSIGVLVRHLLAHGGKYLAEILVVDGGSQDATLQQACEAGACVVSSSIRGRAHQMNLGAQKAKGDILYFVHADAMPPATCLQDIIDAVQEGYAIGCFRSRFDSEKLLLKINGYCSRFDRLMCRGGDQTLFVSSALFQKLGGYDEYYVVMEEYDFIQRARREASFKIIPKEVLISARKYEKNSYMRVNLANFIVFTMYRLGYPPPILRDTYRKLINYPV